jgi:hypothetical protein
VIVCKIVMMIAGFDIANAGERERSKASEKQ